MKWELSDLDCFFVSNFRFGQFVGHSEDEYVDDDCGGDGEDDGEPKLHIGVDAAAVVIYFLEKAISEPYKIDTSKYHRKKKKKKMNT